MTWTPALTVAELLTASREAHKQYRAKSGTVHKDGKIKDAPLYSAAREAIEQASDLRVQAEALDPERRDPAWADDRVPHADLMKFYANYLSTP